MTVATQTTQHILMVRPAHFGFNDQTAASNAFQQNDETLNTDQISERALAEFDDMVELLRQANIHVTVAQDSDLPVKPDAIFPNNWISTHADGTMILYPMFAPIRRLERQPHIIEQLRHDFHVNRAFHLEYHEGIDIFLEGTGSLILDRTNGLAYACVSPRTHISLLQEFCHIAGYRPVAFRATDNNGQEIYHTNVMMTIAETFAVICLDTITDTDERTGVVAELKNTNKDIIEITLQQMMSFAGNMLQVRNATGQTYLVMSQTAHDSLTPDQISRILKHTKIIAAPIQTIETYGGGSARCMIAEVFLAPK